MKTIILFGLVLGALSAAGNVYIAEVGGKVTLQCGITTFKSGLEWFHYNLRILRFDKKGLPSRGETPFKTRTKLLRDRDIEISNIKESDSGKFTCVADGSRHEHHLIVVSVSAPSGPLKVGADATLECKANSGVSGQPEVKWMKPDGSVQTESKVELKHVALSNKGTWQCLVSHEGKKFTKNVTISVEEPVPEATTPTLVNNPKNPNSENGKNSGGIRGPEDQVLLLGLVWWIWVAIGAGGLVVIILIIIIIVMHKRNRRKKKKFLRMKKAQLCQKPKTYCQCVRQTAAAKPQQGRRREKPSALPLQPLLQE